MKTDPDQEINKLPDSRIVRARQFGSYYTPDNIADTLAKWAVRNGQEMIVEPSAGHGALITAAFKQAAKQAKNPSLNVTAFDIDPSAIEVLKNLEFANLTIKKEDFLEHSSADQVFDVVLANPPFTRNHSLTESKRKMLRERSGALGAIGLWGYFLLHSLKFLRHGGRLASIVPRSAIFTNHGKKFLGRLCENFSSVGIYALSNKPVWSNSADEDGAVILADGHGGRCNTYSSGELTDDGEIIYRALDGSGFYSKMINRSVTLGSVASISIGTVTGRNSVFLLTEGERISARLSTEDIRPVISRSRQLKGLSVDADELYRMACAGNKTWLLSPAELNEDVLQYLKVVPEIDRESVGWFRKRKPWWKVNVVDGFDAVFTYMNDLGPRLVQVGRGITCTNTLHSVRFHQETQENLRLSAFLTPISTFGQLAAERIGRKYGGGILKFEVGDARRLPIIEDAAFTIEFFALIDVLFREGKFESARDCVDEVIMKSTFGVDWSLPLDEMRADLILLRQQRRNKIGKK